MDNHRSIRGIAATVAVTLVMVMSTLTILGAGDALAIHHPKPTPLVGVATTSTSWNGYLPAKTLAPSAVPINQTLVTSVKDSYAEMGVSANIGAVKLPNAITGENYFEVIVNLMAMANTRLQNGYLETGNFQLSIPTSLDNSPRTLGADQGIQVSLGRYFVCYYGAYYNKMYISSNGFLILTNEFPSSIPSSWNIPQGALPSVAEPNAVIAPLGRYFNGATVTWGNQSSTYFWVVWTNMADRGGGTTGQSFGIRFFIDDFTQPISFAYGNVVSKSSDVNGYEDQLGSRGNGWQSSNSNTAFSLLPADGAKFYVDYIRIDATKTIDAGSNDVNAAIQFDGSSGIATFPGGTNLEVKQGTDPADDGDYRWAWVGPASDICLKVLSKGLVVVPVAGELITAYGLVKDGIDLLQALSPKEPDSRTWNSLTTTNDAYVLYRGQDDMGGLIGLGVWDSSLMPKIRWRIMDTNPYASNHLLKLKVTLSVCDARTPAHVKYPLVTELNLKLNAPSPALSSGGVQYFSITNPNANPYRWMPIENSYGLGCNVNGQMTEGSGYEIIAWDVQGNTRTIGGTKQVDGYYVVSADGTLKIDGYFYLNDDFAKYGINPSGRRMENMYVLDADHLGTMLGKFTVLDSTSTVATWYHIIKTVSLNQAYAGKKVLVGFGRTATGDGSYYPQVQFAGVKVYDWDDVHYLTVTAGPGGTTAPSPNTYPYYPDYPTVTVTAVPNSGYKFSYWMLNEATQVTNNPTQVSMAAGNAKIQAFFLSADAPTAPGTPTWTASDERDGMYTVSWAAASDPDTTPVARYWLQQAIGTGSWTTLSDQISGTSYDLAYRPPATYHYRVCAIDTAGLTGPWSGTSADCVVPWDARLTSNSGTSSTPVIAVDLHGNYHIVWSDNTNDNNYEIYYKKVDSNWNTVSDLRITTSAGDSITPAVAYWSGRHGDALVVTWADNRNGNYAIYTRSCLKGVWGAETLLVSIPGTDCRRPDVAADLQGRFHYVYHTVAVSGGVVTETVMYNGLYGANVPLQSYSGTYLAGAVYDHYEHTRIAAGASGTIHVLFSFGPRGPVEPVGYAAVWYRCCVGGVWRDPILLRDTSPEVSRNCSIAADAAGHVYVLWDAGWPNHVFYTKSNDGGVTWSYPTIPGGNTAAAQTCPDVAVGLVGEVLIVWMDSSTTTYSIRCVMSTDYGNTWGSVIVLTSATGNSYYPRACIGYNDAYYGEVGVVWQDSRNAGNWEVYFTSKCLLD
jgi:hypothetical protein